MTVVLWIVTGIVAFVIIYKLLYRKNFIIIRYLKDKIGCSEAVAHRFVAYRMPELVGFQGWANLRDELLKDANNYDLVILPLFVDWFLKQSSNELILEENKKIIQDALKKSGITFDDIERNLYMVEPMLSIYRR